MTIQLFLTMLTIGSAVSSLLTQAVKKALNEKEITYSSNVLALIDAGVIGVFGTIISYILMGIEWNVVNIVCIPLMAVAVWVASMIGYDKVIQLIAQIGSKD